MILARAHASLKEDRNGGCDSGDGDSSARIALIAVDPSLAWTISVAAFPTAPDADMLQALERVRQGVEADFPRPLRSAGRASTSDALRRINAETKKARSADARSGPLALAGRRMSGRRHPFLRPFLPSSGAAPAPGATDQRVLRGPSLLSLV